MEDEKWLPVVGYEGLYEVSDWGRVKGVDRTVDRSDGWPRRIKGRIKRLIPTFQGYLIAHLSRDNLQISRGIHRLVLTAFVCPPPFEGAEVNHKDFDKTNNRPSNLEWVSHQANMDHACADGRARPIMGIKKSPKFTPEVVADVRKLCEGGMSPMDISEKTGVPKNTVWDILSNKTWAAPTAPRKPRRGSAAIHASKAVKLTLEQVRDMRSKYLAGARQVDLADEFGVWQGTVSAIVRNKTWSEGITSPSGPGKAL
jgi:hypothetical protein